MNSAWVGLISGATGAVIGGSASFFGPLRLERRKESAALRSVAEARRKEDLSRVIEAQVTCNIWLRFLRRVAAGDSRVSATEFENRNDELAAAAERAITELSFAGLEDGRSGLIDMMRSLEKTSWQAMRLQRSARAAIMDETAFHNVSVSREQLMEHYRQVLREREQEQGAADLPPRPPTPPVPPT
jgi:hypothetical protein